MAGCSWRSRRNTDTGLPTWIQPAGIFATSESGSRPSPRGGPDPPRSEPDDAHHVRALQHEVACVLIHAVRHRDRPVAALDGEVVGEVQRPVDVEVDVLPIVASLLVHA